MTAGKHNLAALAEAAFERTGDHPALFFEGAWHDSGALRDRCLRLASGLQELGIEPGDRVVVMMTNCPEVGLLYTALWRAGAVITPALFLLSADDLRHILESSEATAVVTTPEILDTVKVAAKDLPSVKWILATEIQDDPEVVPLTSLEDAVPGEIVPRDDSELAALMYTGGTTGRAKGVMISHENLWHAGRAGHEVTYIPGINRTAVPLPLAHSYGLLVTAAGLHAEEPGVAILQRWFDAPNLLELIQEHKVQQAAVVPTMLQLLLAQPLEDYDLSSLQKITSGASPLSPGVVEEFERRVPGVEIREGYGLTETTALISTNPFGARKLGSVGVPAPGCEVRVLDDEGNQVPSNEPGEIAARSPMIMLGYWRSDGEGDVSADGWFRTGDIGRVDEDGYIWIMDRKKDLIIRGGFNVYPRDIEEVLLLHPAVAQAGVVGRPDEARGEEVVAFVQLHPGEELDEEDLIAFARERLGKYKYPREVRFVDSVPLTPVFKIDRKQLRALLKG